MTSRDPLQLPVATVLLVLSVVSWYYSDFFGKEVLTEIAIFAIFAMSLDLLAGYAGMVSLGHAAFLAIGAYATAAFTVFLGWPVSISTLAAILVAAATALLVGIFAVRLGGIFFIMITLAIGQMCYAYFFKSREFGADDGMSGTPRFDLGAIGLDANDPAVFAALAVVFAVLVYGLLLAIVRSPFGMMLIAIHQNEHRLRSLGCPVLKYKLAAYVLAGALGGLAGSLTAQHTGFVSPDLAFWTVSGEALIMVIVGGMGSLSGPIIGAAVIILMRHELSALTEFWTFYMGLFFVAVVLLASNGIYGGLTRLWRILRMPRSSQSDDNNVAR